MAARVASVAQEAVEADDGAPEADASDSRSDQKLKGVQSPASVWLPFRTSTEQKARPGPSAAPPQSAPQPYGQLVGPACQCLKCGWRGGGIIRSQGVISLRSSPRAQFVQGKCV